MKWLWDVMREDLITGESDYQDLLDTWFPADGQPPSAFLLDTSEEALLIPDWLKLRMIRSHVTRLVDTGVYWLVRIVNITRGNRLHTWHRLAGISTHYFVSRMTNHIYLLSCSIKILSSILRWIFFSCFSCPPSLILNPSHHGQLILIENEQIKKGWGKNEFENEKKTEVGTIIFAISPITTHTKANSSCCDIQVK